MSVRCTHACSATKVPLPNSAREPFTTRNPCTNTTRRFAAPGTATGTQRTRAEKTAAHSGGLSTGRFRATEEDDWLSYRHAADLDTDSQIDALGGLYLVDAGLVDLPSLCHALLEHSRIQLIAEAKQPREQENWVIACGTSSRDFSLGVPLEIGSVWGQPDWIKPTAAHLPNPIVGNGYAIPGEDAWVIGRS